MSRKIAGLSQEQHAARSESLGSSDAATASGLSPFKSAVELWLEKTGRVEPTDLSGSSVVYFGNVMEEVVAQEFAARNNTTVRQRHQAFVKTFKDSTLKMVAHVDRLTPPRKILECKNVSAYGVSDWKDSPPAHYRLQVEHQLICANRNEAYIAAIIGGNDYVQHEVERNFEMSEFLIAREKEFWRCVETDTPPEPKTASDVAALYPVDNSHSIAATPELIELHAELINLRAQLKKMKATESEVAEQIQIFIGENETLVDDDGCQLASWKTDKGTLKTDFKKAFDDLAALHEVNADQFLSNYQSTRRTRRFLVKGKKND